MGFGRVWSSTTDSTDRITRCKSISPDLNLETEKKIKLDQSADWGAHLVFADTALPP